ncbi:putative membrane protein [Streptomyces sp. PanSC19]|nr:putative membrane protein [Streptomyces sp. PanSC19]
MSWAARFRLRQRVKASLWVMPTLGLVLGVLLAELALLAEGTQVPGDWRYSATTASGVLTAIVGAMVALLGFVVTIGVLVVQQATGTLSPRYMRLWYRDRLQKAVLATFTGTFAFSFSLLRRVEAGSVPDLGVTLAGAAVAVSLVLLLVYLNRFTHRLRPVAIAELVTRLGETVLADGAEAVRDSAAHGDRPLPPGGPVMRVRTEAGGAVQAFDVSGLLAEAVRHDCVLVVPLLTGDSVPPGTVLVEVHGGRSRPDPARVLGLVALGAERTIEQDPAFALRVLVDIAIRALSPAVNDPTTAVQVVNYIERFLHRVGTTRLPGRHVLADARGEARLVLPGRTWDTYLQLAVCEIRDYGSSSVQICRRLRAVLEGLLDALPPELHPPVHAEMRLLQDSVEREFTDPARRVLAQQADHQGIGGRLS